MFPCPVSTVITRGPDGPDCVPPIDLIINNAMQYVMGVAIVLDMELENGWSFRDEFWFSVTFICPLPAKKEIFLHGDFNGWKSCEKYRMQLKDGVYQLVLLLSEGYYHYKFFVDGRYERDENNPHVGGSFGNSVMFVHMDPCVYSMRNDIGILHRSYFRPGWGGKELIVDQIPISSDIASFGVLERPVFVYLPPSYYSIPKKFYPVMYAFDGQNLFSSYDGLPCGGWHLDQKLDEWWSSKVLPEFILVGIPNSDYVCIGNRQKEYTAKDFITLEDEPFVQYLLQVIKPAIDQKYNTLSDSSHTFILGASLGGLLAFLLHVSFPNAFSCAVCVSPAFWFIDSRNQSAFTAFKKRSSNNYKLYIDSGDGEGDNKELVREMATLLNESNVEENVNFKYYYDQCKDKVPLNITHAENVWRDRIIIGFKFCFSKIMF